ncbi:hypothetical protein [Flavobacterium sp.]|uniref:hypothetical protein n=1 Tax=Flavobacterium sp. TaxID=239 RepID=UPI0025CEBFE7|nr:hypothetical protein [Flavobacterium sp.]
MKTLFNIRTGLLLFIALVVVVCSLGQYANSGTPSDRTGTNGATNGSGKAPKGNAHAFKNWQLPIFKAVILLRFCCVYV